VVTLAATQALQALTTERAGGVRRTTGHLFEGADGTDAEARVLLELGFRAHRQRSVRSVEQVEPQQNAVAAGAVHLAVLERLPDGVAIAPFGVHGHQAAGQEERGLAFDFELQERWTRVGMRIEGHRLAGRTELRAEDAPAPFLVTRADGV